MIQSKITNRDSLEQQPNTAPKRKTQQSHYSQNKFSKRIRSKVGCPSSLSHRHSLLSRGVDREARIFSSQEPYKRRMTCGQRLVVIRIAARQILHSSTSMVVTTTGKEYQEDKVATSEEIRQVQWRQLVMAQGLLGYVSSHRTHNSTNTHLQKQIRNASPDLTGLLVHKSKAGV